MSYLFYGINSAVKYARDGYAKELSDFLSKKPHLINTKNKNGNSILHIACWKGDCDMVLMLLMRGANVNQIDSKGYSPLLVAIEFGHDDLAMSLLERGADVTIANQAMCLPLHVAALTGCKNMIIPLLERGADINAIETNGCTPLLCALRGKHSDVAIILIDKGADLTARDRDDWLPIGLAKMNGLTAVVAAISLRFEYQSLALSRSASARDIISERQMKESPGPILQQRASPEDEINVMRSQSQPALVHTMSSGASVGSASVASKTSKGSKSGKKKRKERRTSVSEISTTATTAAIEAVTKAMQECGGDVAKAALLLIRQQQQPRSKDGTKRRSSKREDRSDEFSVSVISEGTTASKLHSSSVKKRASTSDVPLDRTDDDDRSVQSGSTKGSRGSRSGARSKDRSSSRDIVDDDNTPLDGARRSRSERGGLLPIEEEVVIRRGSRTGSHSSKGSGSPVRRHGSNRVSLGDDVDSDGEPFGPPAIFCFFPVAASKSKAPSHSSSITAKKQNSKSACTVM